ncbi:single-strand binding protein [Emticicia oligotrophica DSM 17448]|uniref:Single-stranded DNA-binding protein n=1 Tax=Emticicia oligotrophica (strain DSM 17448 / CIP 109782 / MTCC 6937 / GPTSA100-15) TaxID=929562 RepID=A0ABN4AMC4_EMTOG|nr:MULTISPECIES: single-stranded DNA-binding protein [Emticicia]AFK03380.1 single-strand binding protein [Emticicia oligotrophica DSM 17448]
MAGVNKVILLGNLGSDPEVRTLPSGGKVVTFSIATSESYNNKNGERVEQTEWHRIELWDNLANIAEQYLKKGDTAYVEGRIRSEKWTDKDGIERTTVKIRGNALQLVGGRRGDAAADSGGQSYSSGSSSSNNYAPKSAPVPTPPPVEMAGGDDDLPF